MKKNCTAFRNHFDNKMTARLLVSDKNSCEVWIKRPCLDLDLFTGGCWSQQPRRRFCSETNFIHSKYSSSILVCIFFLNGIQHAPEQKQPTCAHTGQLTVAKMSPRATPVLPAPFAWAHTANVLKSGSPKRSSCGHLCLNAQKLPP